jgi:hypothetical protein
MVEGNAVEEARTTTDCNRYLPVKRSVTDPFPDSHWAVLCPAYSPTYCYSYSQTRSPATLKSTNVIIPHVADFYENSL